MRAFTCPDHDFVTTCRQFYEVGKKEGRLSDDKYEQALGEYQQAFALTQSLEENLPRMKGVM